MTDLLFFGFCTSTITALVCYYMQTRTHKHDWSKWEDFELDKEIVGTLDHKSKLKWKTIKQMRECKTCGYKEARDVY